MARVVEPEDGFDYVVHEVRADRGLCEYVVHCKHCDYETTLTYFFAAAYGTYRVHWRSEHGG
jgi:hypothetical protein